MTADVHLRGHGQPPIERAILHVDMDAFYASVEVLHDPRLLGQPVIVGGSGSRGVVASCSYEARAYGIRSAMPSVQARRLCPHAVFLAGRHGVYAEYSERLHAVFRSFTPLVEPIALDEAFLDVTALARRRERAGRGGRGDGRVGAAAEIAADVRGRIHAELGLWCSVGVATSKLLAKLASKEAKPDTPPRLAPARQAGPETDPPVVDRGLPAEPYGHDHEPSAGLLPAFSVTVAPPRPTQLPSLPRSRPPAPGTRPASGGVAVVDPGQELVFLHRLPVRALWGVGPAIFARLSRFGVDTVGDLAALPVDTVVRALGRANGEHLHSLAWGRDDRPVEPERPLKSVGHEETFATDHVSVASLAPEALRMADAVGRRLRAGGHRGRTVSIKVRFADFRTITRARTLPAPVDAAPPIYETALALLGADDVAVDIAALGVRLLGVSVANLTDDAPEQLDLFAEPERGRDDALSRTLDAVRERYGEQALGPATLASPAGLRVKRAGDTQWGPNR